MKASRAVTRLGLTLVSLSSHVVRCFPRLAVCIADAGDHISAAGLKLACYGY